MQARCSELSGPRRLGYCASVSFSTRPWYAVASPPLQRTGQTYLIANKHTGFSRYGTLCRTYSQSLGHFATTTHQTKHLAPRCSPGHGAIVPPCLRSLHLRLMASPDALLSTATVPHASRYSPAGKLIGRPCSYTPELAATFCERLSTGLSIRKIAAADDMPDADTIFRWLNRFPLFYDQYLRARETRAHARFESIDQTVEDMRAGVIDPQQARVELLARQWQCAKELPRQYGEHQTIDHNVRWDGDPAHLDEGQLAKLALMLEQVVAGQQAQIAPPVTVDVQSEVVSEPEPAE